MGNNASSIQTEPKLKISGPTHLMMDSPLVEETQKQDNEKLAENFERMRSVSQPILSIPEIQLERKSTRNSLPDINLLPKIPHISFNFEGYDMTLFKQIEAHATAASAIDNIQTAFLCSDAGYDMNSRVDPYEELAATATATAAAAAAAAAEAAQNKRESVTLTTRQFTRPSSPQSLKHKSSSSSLLSFKSLKSKASLSSLRSKVSDAAFELVTPPGSIDYCNGERPSIVVTKKTRVLYDGRKGEWQFDVTEANVAEPEPEHKGKYMRRVLRSSR